MTRTTFDRMFHSVEPGSVNSSQKDLEVRHATHPDQVRGFDTAALRGSYLVEDLFSPDTITAVLTHHDRIVLAGARLLPAVRSHWGPGLSCAASSSSSAGRPASSMSVGPAP